MLVHAFPIHLELNYNSIFNLPPTFYPPFYPTLKHHYLSYPFVLFPSHNCLNQLPSTMHPYFTTQCTNNIHSKFMPSPWVDLIYFSPYSCISLITYLYTSPNNFYLFLFSIIIILSLLSQHIIQHSPHLWIHYSKY